MAGELQPGSGGGEASTNNLRQLITSLAIAGVVVFTLLGGMLLTLQDVAGQLTPTPVARATSPPPTAQPSFTPLPTLPPPATATETASPEPEITPTPLPPTDTPRPTSIPTAACQPPASWRLYIVQRGDTLVALAWRTGTTVSAIMQANCLSSQTIYAGQRLFLPPVTILPTPTPFPCLGPPPSWQIYVVQPGDTLYSLARRSGTTITAIIQANCLRGYTIYVGQRLYLPPLPPTFTPTATGTPTDTPTPTPSLTVTVTVTITPTPTETGTPTPTSTTVTVTPPTPTPTGTATATPEGTITVTPMATGATFTPTPTATDTATPPGTAIPPTGTPTATPTATWTLPAPTATPTPTPTPTATQPTG